MVAWITYSEARATILLLYVQYSVAMSSLRTVLDTLARFALLAQLALLPIFFVPSQAVSIAQAKFGLSAILLLLSVGCWAIARLLEGSVTLPKSPLVIASLLLPLAYAASAALSGSFLDAFVSGLGDQDTVAMAVLWVMTLCATAVFVKNVSRLREAVLAIVGGLVLLVSFEAARVLIPSLQTVGGIFPNETLTSSGTWHDMGILVGLAAFISLAMPLFGLVQSAAMRIAAFAVAAFSFLFLLVVSMADIWFALAGVSLLTAVYLLIKEERWPAWRMAKSAGPWALLATLAIVCGLFNGVIHEALPDSISVTAVEVRPSWQGTFDIGGELMDGGKTILFGSGPNTFAKNWVRFKPEGVNETLFWNFDFNTGVGTLPTSFVTVGILGVLAWALLAAVFLFSLGTAVRRATLQDSAVTILLGMSIAYLFVFQIVYVPGVVGTVLLFALLGIFAGVVAIHAQTTIALSMSSVRHFLGGASVIVPAIVLAVTVIPSMRAIASDVAVNQSVLAFRDDQDAAAATMRVQRAIALWPSNDRAHRAAVELGIAELSRLAQSGAAAPQEVLQATLAKTIEHGLSAVSIDDGDYQNWLTLAQLYQELSGAGVEGSLDAARNAYKEVIADNPSNPVPHVRLAQLSLAENDLTGAIQHLDDAIKLKQNLAFAHYLRAQALAQKGDLEGALAAAAIVVQIAPQDPMGWYTLGVILYSAQAWSDAGTAFAQAAILRPDFANAYFMYGLAAANVGEFAQATQAFMKVVELDPSQTAVQAMIANVAQGRPALQGLVPDQAPAATSTPER